MYLSSDWAVRLGVTSCELTCAQETKLGNVSGQPIRLVMLGTDVVAKLALGDCN